MRFTGRSLFPVVPHVLDVFVVLEHVEHLLEILNVALIGELDGVLRHHLHLRAQQLIAVVRERLSHRCHIVGISIDRVNTLVRRKVRRAGFERVVFIIRPELHEAFEEAIGRKSRRFMQVDYAYQTLDNLPEGLTAPEGREKPLGTAHAVWCAKKLTEGCPIAVINADDFYGGEAFKKIGAFLRNVKEDGEKAHWAMVGYHLKNTLTENGHVARGVCVEKDGVLDTIVERTHIEKREDGPAYTEDDGATWHALDEDTTVSMNLWGFTPDFVDALKKDFVSFLENDVPESGVLPAVCRQRPDSRRQGRRDGFKIGGQVVRRDV